MLENFLEKRNLAHGRRKLSNRLKDVFDQRCKLYKLQTAYLHLARFL